MKAQHPEEINLFFANWKKLDAAVRAELGGAPIVGRGRGKRTRRVHRRSRK